MRLLYCLFPGIKTFVAALNVNFPIRNWNPSTIGYCNRGQLQLNYNPSSADNPIIALFLGQDTMDMLRRLTRLQLSPAGLAAVRIFT